jgi:hypothetical protein
MNVKEEAVSYEAYCQLFIPLFIVSNFVLGKSE